MKKIFILGLILILFFSFATASASDINQTDLASENHFIDEPLGVDDFDEEISAEDYDNPEVSITEKDALTASPGTFTDLANDIADADGELNLTKDYLYVEGDSDYGITVSKSIKINGNGHTINSFNQAKGFSVYSDGFVLENLVFLNCGNENFNGCAIYISGNNAVVSNCSFVNSIGTDGGAINLYGANGVVSNCIFMNNSANLADDIYWHGDNGIVSNCNFMNDSSLAVSWSGENGAVSNCCFANNIQGSINWAGENGIVSNCRFVNNSKSGDSAIIWSGVNGSVMDSIFENNSVKSNNGGVFYWTGSNGSVSNCSFVNNSATYGGGAVYWTGSNGSVSNCNFVNNSAYNGGAINWKGDNGNVSNCCFVNNFGTYGSGAISFTSIGGVVCDSKFINNTVDNDVGGCVNGYSENNKVINSSFINNKPYDIYWKVDCEVINCNYSKTNNHCIIISPSPSSMNLNLIPNWITFKENILLNATVTSGATGKISIYIDENFIKNAPVNEIVELNNLTIGSHTIKVIYNGDNYYKPCESQRQFNVNKADYEAVSIYYDEDSIAGDDFIVGFKFDDEDITGNITITFINMTGNNCFTGELINAETTMLIPNIPGGEQHFIFNYSGDSKYNSHCDEWWPIYINFKESPININIDIPEISWGDSVNLTPNLQKDATGNLTLLIDNIFLANITPGNSYSYKALKGGKHNLTVRYSGDDYFKENETTIEFNVNKLDSPLDMENTFDADEYITIPITLADDANGDITISINNDIYLGKVSNGRFDFTVPDLSAGTYTAVINYANDDKYNDIYTAKEITVNLKKTDINLDIHNILKNQNLLIKPGLTGNATGIIDIYVDGEFKSTINAGSSYKLEKPAVGQHKIKLTYLGNSYFEPAEQEFSFRVFAVYPIEAADTQIIFGSDKKFEAKFYDENGDALANKYVLFIVNGTEYPVKTNSEGVAVLDVNLDVGEYNVTSVSLLDENTTNALLVFRSVNAENLIIEYGSDTRFKAAFLDETAKPLSNTNIVFNVDGKDIMVKSDVDGVAVLNQQLGIGTHTIISINTITDENVTNQVVVVSDINSIITVGINDINYTQKAILNVNVGSDYLDGDVEIRIMNGNGYEQIFNQKAKNPITKELAGLDAGKYFVNVKYIYSDALFVLERNATFNVEKINPEISISVDNAYIGASTVISVIASDSNAALTIKLNGERICEGNLVNGHLSKTLSDLSAGEYTVEAIFNGDNNYYPLIKSSKFSVYKLWNINVEFDSVALYEDDPDNCVSVNVYNLANASGILTLHIDGEMAGTKIISEGYGSNYDEQSDEYEFDSYVLFNAENLSEGIHSWKLNYYDPDEYINSTQTGLFKVYHVGDADKVFLVNKNGSITEIDSELEFIKNGTDRGDDFYSMYGFTSNGKDYIAINWIPASFYSMACYKVFNPEEYKEYDGIYYKTINGKISEIIDTYEIIDGVYYEEIGRPYYYYDNGYDKIYSIINGTCYIQQFYRIYEAEEGVDYNLINGSYYTLDGIEITDEPYWPYVIINETAYYDGEDDNIYIHHYGFAVGYDYIKVNGSFYRLLISRELFEDNEGNIDYRTNNIYALIDGEVFSVADGKLDLQVKIDVKEQISNVEIPSFENVQASETASVRLPSDATGTVTLTIDNRNYDFDVVDGVANIKLPELSEGNYTYTISYSGDGKYSPFTNTGSLKVNKADAPENTTQENVTVVDNSRIVASTVKVTYCAGSYYSIKVYGTDGKAAKGVSVKVTGKISKTLKTNANGIAKFKVTQKPGTYKITIKAVNKSLTRTIKVKHLLSLKKVTVKKSAKKLVLTATLGKVNKKYLKNKKITFKFNGKKYTAKTNKKGVAKVTIKSKVLKKLKVGKKVTYQATYKKDTVKKTVKVKK